MQHFANDKDQLVIHKLNEHFGNNILSRDVNTDMLSFYVSKDIVYPVLLFLRDNNDLQYNFLTTLCGMHYPEKDQLGVVYHLHSFVNNHRIRIKTTTGLHDPNLPSVTTIWPAANWMERETYDFFGINFEGHPDLRRILNVDDFEGFPLRKEFPLEDQTREDKDDSMFGR